MEKKRNNLQFNSEFKRTLNTKLDEEILIPLKEKYPALFEKPDE